MSETDSQLTYPPLSIGVVTHQRAQAFSKLLKYLRVAIDRYPSRCELVVANNSGRDAHEVIAELVDASGIRDACECRIVDSIENSISTGRNLVLDNVLNRHLVFVDDDEYPVPHWLTSLAECMHEYQCASDSRDRFCQCFPLMQRCGSRLWICTIHRACAQAIQLTTRQRETS